MKNILVLGSTGSIGVNTLEVINKFNNLFNVFALTANSNVELLEEQIVKFNPKYVVIGDKNKADYLKNRVNGKCIVLFGDEGLIEITKNGDYDILVSSLVGFAGLLPTLEGIKRGKKIALANKEALVVAGKIVMELAKKYNSEILPVDSEHSAIFQCLVGEDTESIEKLIITASGGPFFNKSYNELLNVTVEEALNHPNWDMGNKITIDSSTMMNKGLEVIEAHWLFNIPIEKIDVVVHPQSIIHSMVEFVDGSIKAQLSTPDMKLPIQYALSYPKRLESNFINTNFPNLEKLTFYKPEMDKFRCLKLAFESMEQGGTAPCILNGANEIAVEKFLRREIKYTQIPELIDYALNNIEISHELSHETILECNRQTRELSKKYC